MIPEKTTADTDNAHRAQWKAFLSNSFSGSAVDWSMPEIQHSTSFSRYDEWVRPMDSTIMQGINV